MRMRQPAAGDAVLLGLWNVRANRTWVPSLDDLHRGQTAMPLVVCDYPSAFRRPRSNWFRTRSNAITPGPSAMSAGYTTSPVHTLHERTDGADSVLCRVEPGAIVWGADASLELFDVATRKLAGDEEWRQVNLVDEVAQTAARLVQNSDQPITREIVETELNRSVSQREWTNIEKQLARHGVDIVCGEHNLAIYRRQAGAGCYNTPLSPMW